MQDVFLVPMTQELCRRFYQDFESDPSIYMDMSYFQPYVYSEARADAYYARQMEKGRVFLSVMFEDKPVVEIIFKDMDPIQKECTLSIHLQNDRWKGRGIGTQAERLALSYAFSQMGMAAVNADAVLKNERSQHVLEKAGFQFVRQEGIFRYYRCEAFDFFKNPGVIL